MELEWEREDILSHAAAVAGVFLGAALGADCFLAMRGLIGGPAFLCGAALAFWAVTGGELLSGRRSRAGALLSLPFILLWSLLANHFSFALAAAPGDPGGAGLPLLALSLRLTSNIGSSCLGWWVQRWLPGLL